MYSVKLSPGITSIFFSHASIRSPYFSLTDPLDSFILLVHQSVCFSQSKNSVQISFFSYINCSSLVRSSNTSASIFSISANLINCYISGPVLAPPPDILFSTLLIFIAINFSANRRALSTLHDLFPDLNNL